MTVIGYIRVSTENQDLGKQRHLLLEYAYQQKLSIDEFIEVEISSRKNQRERRITELIDKLKSGDVLIVAELSRLGRNMLETLNLISALNEKEVQLIFVRQPELSTTASHAQLLLAIYSYFAQSEREFISMRTKQGLAAAKARGQQLGRPKGSRNRQRPLDSFRDQIEAYLHSGLSIASIRKLINPHLEKTLSYNSFKYYIHNDSQLKPLLENGQS
ncbi:MAG: resolvase [Anaerolineaceae bacterium]|nr:resolvase [Anaerolineaceae bacterium]